MKIVRRKHYEDNKSALIQKSAARRQEMIDKVWAYKQGKVCADCPQDDPRTFEFDHVRGEKLGNVSTMALNGCSWEKISEEIAKCDVVCASCHRIRTWERGGWVRNIELKL